MAKRSATKGKAGSGYARGTGQRALKARASKVRIAVERRAPATEARASYAKLVDDVEADKRPRRVPGRRVAIVSLADLRRLREMEREDRDDVAAIEEAMRDPRPSVPWESVKAELGL